MTGDELTKAEVTRRMMLHRRNSRAAEKPWKRFMVHLHEPRPDGETWVRTDNLAEFGTDPEVIYGLWKQWMDTGVKPECPPGVDPGLLETEGEYWLRRLG